MPRRRRGNKDGASSETTSSDSSEEASSSEESTSSSGSSSASEAEPKAKRSKKSKRRPEKLTTSSEASGSSSASEEEPRQQGKKKTVGRQRAESSSSSEEKPKRSRDKNTRQRVKRAGPSLQEARSGPSSERQLQQRQRKKVSYPQNQGAKLFRTLGARQSRSLMASQCRMEASAGHDDFGGSMRGPYRARPNAEFLGTRRAALSARGEEVDKADPRVQRVMEPIHEADNRHIQSREYYPGPPKARAEGSRRVRATRAPIPFINPNDAPDIFDERFAAALEDSKRLAAEDEERRLRAQDSDDDPDIKRAMQLSKATANAQAAGPQEEATEAIDPEILRQSEADAKAHEKRLRQQQEFARRAKADFDEATRRSKLDAQAARQPKEEDDHINEEVLRASKKAAKAEKERRRQQQEAEQKHVEQELAEAIKRSEWEHRARVEREAEIKEAERNFGNRTTAQPSRQRRPNSGLPSTSEMPNRRSRAHSLNENSSRIGVAPPGPARPVSSLPQRSASTRPQIYPNERTNRSSLLHKVQNSHDVNHAAVVEGKGKERERPEPAAEKNEYYIPKDWEVNKRAIKAEKDRKRAAMRRARDLSLRNEEDTQLTMAMAASLQDNPNEERSIDDQAEDTPCPCYGRIHIHWRKLDPLKWTTDNGGGLLPGFLRPLTDKDFEAMRVHAINVENEKANAGGSAQKGAESKAQTAEKGEEAEGENTIAEMMQETGRTRAVARQQPSQCPGLFRDTFQAINNKMQSKKKKKKEYPGQATGAGGASSSRRT